MPPFPNNEDIFSNYDKFTIKILILLIFSFVAILTGSVSSVILILIKDYQISIVHATILPLCRYLACIFTGFFISPYVVKMGYRISIVLGLMGTTLSCILMIFTPGLITSTFFFILLGLEYGLIKTSLFSILKLIMNDKRKHVSFVSLMESLYMLGVLAGYLLFSYSIKQGNWLLAYYFFTSFSIILFIFSCKLKIPEFTSVAEEKTQSNKNTFLKTISLYKSLIVILFTLVLLSYIMLEKGIGDWLPTYNFVIYNISMPISIQIASIFSASIAIGRLFYSLITRFLNDNIVLILMIAIALTVIIILYFNNSTSVENIRILNWSKVPYSAYVLPLTGFLVGPVCPAIYSSILMFFSKSEQSRISGLIIIVSGIGSIIGSLSIGSFIELFGDRLVLGFISLLLGALLIFMLFYIFIHKYKSSQIQNQ